MLCFRIYGVFFFFFEVNIYYYCCSRSSSSSYVVFEFKFGICFVCCCFEYLRTCAHCIIEITPLVQPNLGHPRRIMQHNFGHAAGECVRRFVAENVAHMRAGYNF